MGNRIKLLKNNAKREWSDLEWIQEFHRFLQGYIPDGMICIDGRIPKLTAQQAMSVIWYLQEHFPLLPDTIIMWNIDGCDVLFDSLPSGYYCEECGNSCNCCGPCECNIDEELA